MKTQKATKTYSYWMVRTQVTLNSTGASLDLPNAMKILQYVYPALRSQLRNQTAGDDSMENYGTDLGTMDPSSNHKREEMSCVLCDRGIVHREIEGRQALTEEDHPQGPIRTQRLFWTCESGHRLAFSFLLCRGPVVTVYASSEAPGASGTHRISGPA